MERQATAAGGDADEVSGAADASRPQVAMFSSDDVLREDHAARLDCTAVFSGSGVRNDSADFAGGEVTCVFGGLQIDLRDAAMTRPEAVLNVFALFGGVVIKVPAEWSVVVRGVPVLGGLEDKTVPARGAAHRLVIDGWVVIGGLEIRN